VCVDSSFVVFNLENIEAQLNFPIKIVVEVKKNFLNRILAYELNLKYEHFNQHKFTKTLN